MELRFSHRLTLWFSLFGVAIAGGFQYVHLRDVREVAFERERNLAEAASSAVKALVESHFQSGGGPARLGKNLEEMVRNTDIATITVHDTKGNKLVGRFDEAKLVDRLPHPDVPIEKVEDGIYDVEKPLELGGRQGFLSIGFRTAPIQERLHEVSSRAVRSSVMALLGIALSAWLMGTWFGLRIEQIVPRVEALSRNPLEFKPMRSADNDEVGRLSAAFNRLGSTLKSETHRRRELEAEKRELSAMLVHDLKTPLTVICSGITLLKEQLNPEDGEKAEVQSAPKRGPHGRARAGTSERTFELLELSSRRLQRMVEDVLQLSRLEEVAGLRERLPVDMGAMLQACAKDFALVVAERGQKIALKLPRAALPTVSGDAALLRRVVDNLVHNAVEHTPTGGQVTLAAAAENGRVRVSISDSGPGVPPEARADLFRKFFQKDMKRHVGNVGLGLAFCEKVVLRHEGLIGIEDAKPKGACFYFVLPADQRELL